MHLLTAQEHDWELKYTHDSVCLLTLCTLRMFVLLLIIKHKSPEQCRDTM